jgi:hypothetical protein
MKTLIVTVALAAAVATPALAQTRVTVPYWYGNNGAAYGYSYVKPWDRHPHSSNAANDVYDIRGNYVGSDPDPFIRSELAREHGH